MNDTTAPPLTGHPVSVTTPDPGPHPVGAGVDRIDGAYGDHPRA